MKVFVVAFAAAILLQVALAAPGRRASSCSDEEPEMGYTGSDRVLIQRVKGGLGRTKVQHPIIDESSEDASCNAHSEEEEEDCGCEKPSKPSKPVEHDDDCLKVSKTKVVRTSRPCEESEKIYLHRQAPIYVRPPPSRIFINHPPVVVRQPPVILHHQSRSPVLVKPILIKEREVPARPVLFKISKPDTQVHVSKCEEPKVVVDSGCPKPECRSKCTCTRKEKDC